MANGVGMISLAGIIMNGDMLPEPSIARLVALARAASDASLPAFDLVGSVGITRSRDCSPHAPCHPGPCMISCVKLTISGII